MKIAEATNWETYGTVWAPFILTSGHTGVRVPTCMSVFMREIERNSIQEMVLYLLR